MLSHFQWTLAGLFVLLLAAPSKADNCWLKTRYELYTASNKVTPQFIVAENVTTSNFDLLDKTVFLLHGWNSAPNGDLMLVRDAYLKCRSMNVIMVDWTGCAKDHSLDWVASNGTEMVGDHIIQLIEDMEANGQIDLGDTTIVGHSAGAHVAAVVGLKLRSGDASRLGAIVGLDAAQTSYGNAPFRLNINSAKYVETITTSQLGIRGQLGHAAFYPDHGSMQSGCGINVACSHSMAQMYFAESINKAVIATKCDIGIIDFYGWFYTCPVGASVPTRIMGGEPLTHNGLQGTFYLDAVSPSPHFPGQDNC